MQRRYLVWLLFLAACGVTQPPADAVTIDASVVPDADASPPPPPPPVPGKELAPAAGRLTGGGWTVDVQVGSPFHPHSGAPLIP